MEGMKQFEEEEEDKINYYVFVVQLRVRWKNLEELVEKEVGEGNREL
jgi:hypothetical protein